MTVDTAIASITDETLRDVEILATRNPRGEVGNAIKRLRENAKLTQAQVAHRFRRRGSAVANWETGEHQPPRGMTAGLLELFGIPKEIVQQFLSLEIDLDLDATAYAKGDAVELESAWFNKTRGKVLQSIYVRACEGSDQAAKLYKEWMDQNERLVAGRESKPRSVGATESATWTKRALKAGETPQDVVIEGEVASLDTPSAPSEEK